MEKSIKKPDDQNIRDALIKERFKLRNKIDKNTDIPLSILGLIWFNLLILYMLNEQGSFLKGALAIWILFQSELLLKIYLSPSAQVYLRKNPVIAASAVIPLLRVLRLSRYVISSVRRLKKYKQKVFNS